MVKNSASTPPKRPGESGCAAGRLRCGEEGSVGNYLSLLWDLNLSLDLFVFNDSSLDWNLLHLGHSL